jgi:hypothetical protein
VYLASRSLAALVAFICSVRADIRDEVKVGVAKSPVPVGANSRPADKSDKTATMGFSAFASDIPSELGLGLGVGVIEGELFVDGLEGFESGIRIFGKDESYEQYRYLTSALSALIISAA